METKNGNTIFNMREMKDLTNLSVKLAAPKSNGQDKLNVIISGNFRKGMNWIEMVDEMLGLNLKSAPYQPIFKGKVYESSRLFIVVSDLPVSDLKRGFRRDYTDIINLDRPSEAVRGVFKESQNE